MKHRLKLVLSIIMIFTIIINILPAYQSADAKSRTIPITSALTGPPSRIFRTTFSLHHQDYRVRINIGLLS